MKEYKKTIVTIKIPHFGSSGTIGYLKFLSHTNDINQESRGDWCYVTITYGHNLWAWQQFKSSLEKTFKIPEFLQYSVEEVPLFKDDFELLDFLLETMDWTYDTLDDPWWQQKIHRDPYTKWAAHKKELLEVTANLIQIDVDRTWKVLAKYEKQIKDWPTFAFENFGVLDSSNKD